MIDIKLIRENPGQVKENMKHRGLDTQPVDDVLSLDQKRREIIQETEKLKNLRNVASNEIAKMKKEGKDASEKISAMKKTSDDIKKLDEELAELEKQINTKMLDVPNMMEENVPKGKSEKDNVEVKHWGEKPGGDFKFLDHIQLGKKLDILDFDTGAKITGSGFPLYKGKGAMLERALINFMLDTHKQKYTEVFTPFIVNRTSMEVTEEVPIINIHRDEILRHDELPIKYCGYTACFRREAGHYGKETKGFLRVHQFNKVELVNFCKPDKSYTELELMLEDATAIVEALNIHYRVIELCSADLGFSSAKTFDIEVWSPAEDKFLEASSVSNFTDYQSRRAMIRYRPDEPKAKPEFVHILNGSGLATSRLMVSLMESYQTPEGKIIVPKVLHKYTGFEIIG
jgi:seryl-tRNA synthetase